MIEYNTTTKHKVALLRGLYRGRNPSQLQFLLGGLLPSADCPPFSSVSLSLEPFSSVSGPRAPFHWRIASAAALAGQAHGQLCPFRHALYLVDSPPYEWVNAAWQYSTPWGPGHVYALVTTQPSARQW